eukprot:SAG22_NODE_15797_length_340_cov_0.854772_1_plen_113_part_11
MVPEHVIESGVDIFFPSVPAGVRVQGTRELEYPAAAWIPTICKAKSSVRGRRLLRPPTQGQKNRHSPAPVDSFLPWGSRVRSARRIRCWCGPPSRGRHRVSTANHWWHCVSSC